MKNMNVMFLPLYPKLELIFNRCLITQVIRIRLLTSTLVLMDETFFTFKCFCNTCSIIFEVDFQSIILFIFQVVLPHTFILKVNRNGKT